MRRSSVPDPGSSLRQTLNKTMESGASFAIVTYPVPVFGIMCVEGMKREMEDAVTAKTNLCRPQINERRPVHFFGIYDGHGRSTVAALCRDRMHVLMEEELMRVMNTGESEVSFGWWNKEVWKRAIKKCFDRMEEVALNTCDCDNVPEYGCSCQQSEVGLSGCTAVVAVLTQEKIIIANCGDSRAVLCRGGRAIPLSTNEKPDRGDEHASIIASGEKVLCVDGARVDGVLAMSRAIGDKFLKPHVIAEPEVSFTISDPQDECLILASDGLWDVVSNEMACKVAHECMIDTDSATSEVNSGPPWQSLYPTRSAAAAALLTRLALGRNSSDNISVIVVDLKP